MSSKKRFTPEDAVESIRTRNASDGKVDVFIEELPPINSRKHYHVAVPQSYQNLGSPFKGMEAVFLFKEAEYRRGILDSYEPVQPYTHVIEYKKPGDPVQYKRMVEFVEEVEPTVIPLKTPKNVYFGSITSLAPQVSQSSAAAGQGSPALSPEQRVEADKAAASRKGGKYRKTRKGKGKKRPTRKASRKGKIYFAY